MVTNFMEFFKNEREIYVQNVSPGQVSLQFGKGDNSMSFTMPRKKDPLILTNHIPFKDIQASTDFRKLLNRQPAVIRVLEDKEFQKYYADKAKAEKTSVDQAIIKAEQDRAEARKQVAAPVTTAPKEVEETTEETVNAEEAVHPRVIHTCHQASDAIPVADRMKPSDLLNELKTISDEFTHDDYEYILANTKVKTVHTWAKTAQKTLSEKGAK
jgi:hypothetical protein